MKKHSVKMRYARALVGACLGVAVVDIAACSSSQPGQGGKHVPLGHPDAGVDVADARAPEDAADSSHGDAADGAGSVRIAGPLFPPGVTRPSPLEIAENDWGLKLSDEEKERVNICPRRPWSKNVPDRDCTKDNQCGDGLCDRGHCAPIITCVGYPGGPCKIDAHCRGLCMGGLCRSCVSDEECQKKMGDPNGACDAPGSHPPGRSCASSGSSVPAELLKEMCDAAPANKKPPFCPMR